MPDLPSDETPSLAAPLSVRHGRAFTNRLTVAPLTNHQSNVDGTLHDDEYNWLVRRGEGGFGMVMTGAAHVSPEGQTFPGQLAAHDNRFLAGLTRLATGLKRTGTVSYVQLQHGGRRCSAAISGLPPVAPWADESRGVRALSTGEIGRIVQDFVDAAVRVERAGFDGVQVHGAHGYLLGQFLDGTRNQRSDGYGGSQANRFRIIHDVLAGIRASTGPNFQVGLRLSPERQGILLNEARDLASEVMASGLLDTLDISLWDAFKSPYETQYAGQLIDQFTNLPRYGTRLGVAGKIVSAHGAQWCLKQGADFVSIGTGAIIHHDFARHALDDSNFTSLPQPVSREHLARESVGPAFINYLATQWDDFVS